MGKQRSAKRVLLATLAINILIILTNLMTEEDQPLVFFRKRRTTSEVELVIDV